MSKEESQLQILITKRENLFRRIQLLYDLGATLKTDKSQLSVFKARLDNLESTYENYEKLCDQINSLKLVINKEEKIDLKAFQAFEDIYFKIKAFVSQTPSLAVSSASASSSSTTLGRCAQPSARPRLPEIELPLWDSSFKNWPTFYDRFCSLIHDNDSISPIDKFQYLISAISGPALTSVRQSLPLTSQNYTIVWEALVKKYQDKRVLGTDLLDRIVNFPVLATESSATLNNFLDQFCNSITALKSINIPDLSDFILLYLGLQRLPVSTRKSFELSHLSSDIPTLDQLVTFIQGQTKVLEISKSNDLTFTTPKLKSDRLIVSTRDYQPKLKSSFKTPIRKTFVSVAEPGGIASCVVCKLSHSIYKCPKFLELSPILRRSRIRNLKHCFNCLRSSHMLDNCPSKFSCVHCGEKHHSLLHTSSEVNKSSTHTLDFKNVQSSEFTSQQPDNGGSSALINSNCLPFSYSTVLLGTAVIHVKDSDGNFQPVRILIDSGAQTSIITSSCVQRLGLSTRKCKFSISGLGKSTLQNIKGITSCLLKPRDQPEPLFNIDAVILPKITSDMPSIQIPASTCKQFKHLILADPKFDQPSPIDLLIAADLFPQIYDGPRIVGAKGPSALHSVFGWVITGKVETPVSLPEPPSVNVISLHCTFDPSLDELLKRFWESEEVPTILPKSPDGELCEELYSSLHYREPCGRYVVPLLFKHNPSELPSPMVSHKLATSRLRSVEGRLRRQPDLKITYSNFLEKYESLGHMQNKSSCNLVGNYFIPHHPVINSHSSTTQLRVVFDASAKFPGCKSLNECLHIGPKLQLDISTIITRFRFYRYVLISDMQKMYRQILIRPEDRVFQHILWRPSPDHEPQEFQLNTVTYGVSSSPFLAIRTIHQLVMDDGENYPLASKALLSGTYVDNIVTGASSIKEIQTLKKELITLLSLGGFELHKWSSNYSELLSDIPEDRLEPSLSFDLDSSPSISILGLQWEAVSDCFRYRISPVKPTFSKRSILSNIARIYDPQGWISPAVFKAKLIIQHLWRLGLGWDTDIPLYLKKEWEEFATQLLELSKLRIPRNIPPSDTRNILIGFCDASEKGFGCVIYLCSGLSDSHTTHLLAAKTKVAPLKSLSIPRLELCGAVLLSKLFPSVSSSLPEGLVISDQYAFTDSTTVLAWLKTPPYLLKPFVATRVSAILEVLSPSSWFHISSTENPADCVSRGLSPHQLLSYKLWWHGPPWLMNPLASWQLSTPPSDISTTLPELKPKSSLNTLIQTKKPFELLFQYSSLIKLQRVTATCFRFYTNLKALPENRMLGPLTSTELQNSMSSLVAHVQREHFAKDLKALSTGKICSPYIQSLKPFLDSKGLLRVGGRIVNSLQPMQVVYPLLLPKSCHLTTLIIDYHHAVYFHVGPRTLQSILCRKFWIISARSAIRSRLSKCNTCHRASAPQKAPLMGDLPAPRVQQGRPFINVGVDFGGPFLIKESKRRGSKHLKSYLCLFICLSTKAVHLEIVSDLTTDAFIASFDRFVSRRGICHNIYSDRGTNFIGANKYLSEVHQFLSSSQSTICDALSKSAINWKFNAPLAPHMGGIWESGIRSVKHHLKRVVGEQVLTLEELSTVFCKVEAILNSRPLCTLSTDPSELDVLTPGHFLVGSPLIAVPEHDLQELTINRLDRWQLTQRISQQFWRRWSRDYLHTLQQRSKWTTSIPNIKVGDLVLLIEERIPSLQWPMGIVEIVHPGQDGVVRVVTVRTTRGTYLRPVVKLSPLPTQ